VLVVSLILQTGLVVPDWYSNIGGKMILMRDPAARFDPVVYVLNSNAICVTYPTM
jgi:hypothetical protein